MSDVSFDEESTLAPIQQARASQPALVGLAIRWGFAKDEKGAHMVLIGVVVAAVILAIAVPLLMREKEIPLRTPVVPMPTQTNGF
jgi:hypothetical protein